MTKSKLIQKHKYRLRFVPSAWAEWQALDGSVKEPMRKLLKKRLDNPHVPGAALHGELDGYYKIKLRKQGFRLVYGVEDDALIVMVMAVDKREDGLVYRSALDRLTEKVSALAEAIRGIGTKAALFMDLLKTPQPIRHAGLRWLTLDSTPQS